MAKRRKPLWSKVNGEALVGAPISKNAVNINKDVQDVMIKLFNKYNKLGYSIRDLELVCYHGVQWASTWTAISNIPTQKPRRNHASK